MGRKKKKEEVSTYTYTDMLDEGHMYPPELTTEIIALDDKYERTTLTRDIYSLNQRYAVVCADKSRLSVSNIMQTLEELKGKLMIDCLQAEKIARVECHMTPETKDILIKASRRAKMYGKKPISIPRFDENWKQLPDRLDTIYGMNIVLEEPSVGRELFIKLEAIPAIINGWSTIYQSPSISSTSSGYGYIGSMSSSTTGWRTI